jgi:hypothetical protein
MAISDSDLIMKSIDEAQMMLVKLTELRSHTEKSTDHKGNHETKNSPETDDHNINEIA